MQRVLSILFLSVLVFTASGCDSQQEEEADRIVGNWTVTQVDAGGDDLTEVFDAIGEFRMNFGEDEYEFLLMEEGSATVTLSEDIYDVQPLINRVVLRASVSGQTAVLPIGYRFTSEDTLELTVSESEVALLELLLNTYVEPDIELSGDVTLTLSRS